MVVVRYIGRAWSAWWAPQRFGPHRCDRCSSLTLTCRISQRWRSCERCNNFLSSLWTPLIYWLSSRGMCVNWNEQQLVACVTGSCNQLQRSYQECSCPSLLFKDRVYHTFNRNDPVQQVPYNILQQQNQRACLLQRQPQYPKRNQHNHTINLLNTNVRGPPHTYPTAISVRCVRA